MLIANRHIRSMFDRLVLIASAPGVRFMAFFLFPYAALLIGLDVAARYGELTDQHLPVQFFLSQDWSFGEYLEYSLMLAMAVMLLVLQARTGRKIYLVFGILFLFLTADNALGVHEQVGAILAPFMPSELALGPAHIGEAMMFAVLGTGLICGTFLGLRKADAQSYHDAAILAALIGMTALFGVFVDALTALDGQSNTYVQIMAFLEDGGEFAMIILSFLAVIGISEREERRGSDQASAVDPHRLNGAAIGN